MFSTHATRKTLTKTLTVAAALVMVATANGAAAAATGNFEVEGIPVLMDPEDYTCYSVSWNAGDHLVNDTDTTARIYSDTDCDEGNFLGNIRRGRDATARYSRTAGVLFDPNS